MVLAVFSPLPPEAGDWKPRIRVRFGGKGAHASEAGGENWILIKLKSEPGWLRVGRGSWV